MSQGWEFSTQPFGSNNWEYSTQPFEPFDFAAASAPKDPWAVPSLWSSATPASLNAFGNPPVNQNIFDSGPTPWEPKISAPAPTNTWLNRTLAGQPYSDEDWAASINKIWAPLSNIPSRIASGINQLTRTGEEYSYGTSPAVPENMPGEQLTQLGGDIGSALTSPGNLMLGGAGALRGAALSGIPTAASESAAVGRAAIGSGAGKVIQAMSAPVALSGAQKLANPESTWPEFGAGAIELGGGLLGLNAGGPRVQFGSAIPDRPALTGAVDDFFAPPSVKNVTPTGPVPTTAASNIPSTTGLPREVVIKNPNLKQNAELKAQGYVPGGVNKDGYPVMILPPELMTKEPTVEEAIATAREQIEAIKQDFGVNSSEYRQAVQAFESVTGLPVEPKIDPNLNAGVGDAELAGSTPYQPTPQGKITIYKNMNQLYTDWDKIPQQGTVDTFTLDPNNPDDIQKASEYLSTSRALIKKAINEKMLGESDEPSRMFKPDRHPTAERWESIVKELDAENAPDHAYRDILSTGSKDKLKRGETWRSRVMNYIKILDDRFNEPSQMRRPDEIFNPIQYTPQNKDLMFATSRWRSYLGNSSDPGLDFHEATQTLLKIKNEGLNKLTPEELNEYRNLVSQVNQDRPGSQIAEWLKDDKITGEVFDIKPSQMRVPGSTNIAMGGADPRVLDILGTALYTRDRPATVVKELLQNSVDEHNQIGSKNPIRIAFRHDAVSPVTKGEARSIIVKDFGRGLNADQLYTIFSDIGKTGKGNVADAAGGFGLAKAAPFLSGDYMIAESTVLEKGRKVKYIIKGTPAEFKKQNVGVPLTKVDVGPKTPTGLRVEVFFPKDKPFWEAEKLLRDTVKGSPQLKNVEFLKDFTSGEQYVNDFLENGKPRIGTPEVLQGEAIPLFKDKLNLPEADLDIHYELDDKERRSIDVTILNNGLYVMSYQESAGFHEMPHLPAKVVVNIKSKVEEGESGYPFGANREELSRDLRSKISKWIDKNIIDNARNVRTNELQKVFDDLKPAKGRKFVVLDSGERYTPAELANINHSFSTVKIADEMEAILNELGTMFEKDPAKKGDTVKFGFIIGEPSQGGINIPSPKEKGKFAVLMNPFGAVENAADPNEAAQRMVHVILHEFTHNLARSEGAGYTWELSRVYQKYNLERQLDARNRILGYIKDQSGSYAPEFQNLLYEYQESRRRPATKEDTLSRERASEFIKEPEGPSRITGSSGDNGEGTSLVKFNEALERIKAAAGGGGGVPPISNETTLGGEKEEPIKPIPLDVVQNIQRQIPQNEIPPKITQVNLDAKLAALTKNHLQKESIIRAALDFNRTLLTAFDLSAPGRQGLPLIYRKEWWTSLDDMIKAWGSQEYFDTLMGSIKQHPSGLFSDQLVPVTVNGRQVIDRKTGLPKVRVQKSYAERVGLVLTDMLGHNEEYFRSKYAERYVPGVAMSNRAFVGFLNKLRADVFVAMMNQLILNGKDPFTNLELGKQIANFVNTSTGRGSLNFEIPRIPLPYSDRNLIDRRVLELEGSTKVMAEVFFAPRLMASRIQTFAQVFNPKFYNELDPSIRWETLKSLMAIVGVGGLIGQMVRISGLGTVSTDPFSSDFMKIKIGNSRFDPFAGFQQYVVAAARLAPVIGGYSTSTMSGKTFDLSRPGYGETSRADVRNRFIAGKFSPLFSFIEAWMQGSEFDGQPFEWKQALINRTIPIVLQDLQEVYRSDPAMMGKNSLNNLVQLPGAIARDPGRLKMMVPPFFGAGIQTYGR